MKTILKIFVLFSLLLLLLCDFAKAADTKVPGPHHRYTPTGRLINEVAMNVINPAFTLRKNLSAGYAKLMLHVFFEHANNGTLTMTCRSLENSSGQRQFVPTTCKVSDGVCTFQGATTGGSWVSANTFSADAPFVLGPINLLGYHDLRCFFAHGGAPDAGDKLTVDGFLTTQ